MLEISVGGEQNLMRNLGEFRILIVFVITQICIALYIESKSVYKLRRKQNKI